MYTTVETVQRIKELAKIKGIKISEIMTACELNINTLSSMSNRGSWIQANSLAKIADYLDCSVDYLLGRTDNPEENIIDNHNATITGGVQAIKNPVTVNAKENTDQNDIMAQFMRAFSDLSLEKKVAALEFVLQMKRNA